LASYGGSGNGAAFLEKFIEKGVKWIHLDIASAPKRASNTPGVYGVRGLIELIKNN
jgi:leucyl aminopeptidase